MERPSVLVIIAEEDRPRGQPVVDAISRRHAAIASAPDNADAVVLIASPHAAASPDVDRLLEAWTSHRAASAVVIVLVDGALEWNTVEDAFDRNATTALSERAQALFGARPLWLDGRSGLDRVLVARVAAAVAPPAPEPSPASAAQAAPAYDVAVPPPAPITGAAPPPAGERPRKRRPIVGVALALIVLAAAGVVAIWLLADPGSEPIFPPPPGSSPSPILVLVFGVGIGAGLALVVTWLVRRSRPAAPITTHPVATPQPVRATVFISHDVDADHALAVRLAGDLRSDADVWMAPESIEPGEAWLTSVERGLGLSRVFLALLSRASLASPWVVKEIQAAMDLEVQQRLRLVPVQVESCDIPILLRTYQLLPLSSGYQQVVEHARRLAARPLPQ